MCKRMLELENGLLIFMEMLIKVALVSIMSFQYLQSLVHLLGVRFLTFFLNFILMVIMDANFMLLFVL